MIWFLTVILSNPLITCLSPDTLHKRSNPLALFSQGGRTLMTWGWILQNMSRSWTETFLYKAGGLEQLCIQCRRLNRNGSWRWKAHCNTFKTPINCDLVRKRFCSHPCSQQLDSRTTTLIGPNNCIMNFVLLSLTFVNLNSKSISGFICWDIKDLSVILGLK